MMMSSRGAHSLDSSADQIRQARPTLRWTDHLKTIMLEEVLVVVIPIRDITSRVQINAHLPFPPPRGPLCAPPRWPPPLF